jgi:crotonobetainyl-CoA:carnitine CoA-transferase CaiB-like acyl-CoA transferase
VFLGALQAAFDAHELPSSVRRTSSDMTSQTAATAAATDRPLVGVRVLDLCEPLAQYSTKLLADLGADVILVEPPGGGAGVRRLPPFYHDDPDPSHSLPFWYFNTSKRSVTCNLATDDGRALFGRLLGTSQVVVAGQPPDRLLGEAWGFSTLHEQHPRLIWASVSGFGDWGPHAGWLAPDLVGVAMSGILTLAGYPDRAPTMPPGRQGALGAGIQAAQGILMALRVAERGGPGQQVEVSMQEALSLAQETAMQTWDMQKRNRVRVGETRALPGFGTYRTADGYVYSMVGVPGFGAPWTIMVDWMKLEGLAEDLAEPRWLELMSNMNMRELAAAVTDPERMAELRQKFEHVDDVLARFFAHFDKRYLYEEGQRRRLLMGPVNSTRDLVENPQLNARDWYRYVEHPELQESVLYPGPPFRLSRSPWQISRRAPLVGEHNVEVWEQELGYRRDQLATLAGAGVL